MIILMLYGVLVLQTIVHELKSKNETTNTYSHQLLPLFSNVFKKQVNPKITQTNLDIVLNYFCT